MRCKLHTAVQSSLQDNRTIGIARLSPLRLTFGEALQIVDFRLLRIVLAYEIRLVSPHSAKLSYRHPEHQRLSAMPRVKIHREPQPWTRRIVDEFIDRTWAYIIYT
jgi:hypothetical protein